MASRRLSLFTVLVSGALTLVLFQNCSKVGVADQPATMNKAEGVATATNSAGENLPVSVLPAEEVLAAAPPVGASPEMDPMVHGDEPSTQPVETSSDDLVAACGLNLNSIHNVIDLAQYKDSDVHLALLQGKTLIYSSDASVEIKSLNIDAAVGRTILCGVKVDKLDVKKGRLEVYHSQILSIGKLSGVLIHDADSILPAGI